MIFQIITENSKINNKDLLAFNGMVLTGMLFLLGLSSDISERKMILYFSMIPFLLFIANSMALISGRASLNSLKKYTLISLMSLLIVFLFILLDIVLLDSTFSKVFDEKLSMTNNNETNSIIN